MKTILRIGGMLVLGSFLLVSLAFSQQDYPTKAVTMIHGYSAGGSTDLSVRVLAEALSKIFNQPFVTVPKPGGGQTIAASFLARSTPDGHTIGQFYQAVFSTVPYLQEVPYKFEDLKPVIGWMMNPQMFVCRSDAPYKDLKELVAVAKIKSVSFGHSGKGSVNYMVPVVFAKNAGIKFLEVPFKGDSEQLAAVLGGHVNLGAVTEISATPLLEAGKIRALVTFSKKRSSYNPEIPTFEEHGFNVPIGVPVGMWFVPKGTPDAVVKKLHDAIKSCNNDPKVKEEFAKLKQELIYVDPKAMLDIIEKEKEIYYPILKEVGLAK